MTHRKISLSGFSLVRRLQGSSAYKLHRSNSFPCLASAGSFQSVFVGTLFAVVLSLFTATTISAQKLDQDAFAIEKGPHFFDNKCCFCKEVSSVEKADGGYMFLLADGRELFVGNHLVRPAVDSNQWYCPAHAGSERCGLIQLGS